MKIYLVGAGMGAPETVTVAARRALDESGFVCGSARLVESLGPWTCETAALVRTDDIVSAVAGCGCETASVLLSGDVGFFSGAAGLVKALAGKGADVECIPGVSSVQYFFAKLGMPWQDAFLVSAHGREADIVDAVRRHAKVFALTGGSVRANDLCARLVDAGMGEAEVFVGENLSLADERIVHCSAAEAAAQSFGNLAVLVVLNPQVQPAVQPGWGIPDDAFARGGAPLTKEEVRTLAVSKLRVAPGHTVWDVGSGTGSVTVACALAAGAGGAQGKVYAVDSDPDACRLTRENARRFGLDNVHVTCGAAPGALAGLPAPDCVFVGGSKGNLTQILDAALAANPKVRIVVTAVLLETAVSAVQTLEAAGAADVKVVTVQVSRSRTVGASHMMVAQNPVTIVSAGGEDPFAPLLQQL